MGAVATRDEIEAQIESAPTDDAAFLILGDLLQLEGDPRGELIAIDAAALDGNHRGRWNLRRHELFERHPALAPPSGRGLRIEWHLGFVRRVTVSTSAAYGELFQHPSSRFVTEVVFLDYEAADFPALVAAISRLTPHLRFLAIGDPESRHYRWAHERARLDLPALVETLPYLEHLYACEPVTIGNAPRLRTLRLEGDLDVLLHLQTAHLPALEKLSLHDFVTHDVHAFDRIRWLLDSPPPGLVDLELIDIEGDDFVELLSRSALVKQLRALRLWNAGITLDGARLLASSCGHLDLLDLSDPLLSDAAIAAVAGVAREVRTVSPWMRDVLRRG